MSDQPIKPEVKDIEVPKPEVKDIEVPKPEVKDPELLKQDTEAKEMADKLKKLLMNDSSNSDDIIWDGDGQSGMPKSGGSRVYKLAGYIKSHVYGSLQLLANKPDILTGDNYKDTPLMRYPSMFNIWPKSDFGHYRLRDIIQKAVFDNLNEYISNIDNITAKDSKAPMDNFTFLSKIALKRNWKKECCVCLVEDIMGTTCGCGHTEIVVFRPCSHAICINPCFIKWTKSVLDLKPKELVTNDGQRFIMPTVAEVDLNLRGKNITCPMCRTVIDETFRAEDVRPPKELAEKIARQVEVAYEY